MRTRDILWKGLAAMAILAAPGASRADVFNVSADAMLASQSSVINYGSLPEMLVGVGNTVLLRFDLSSIPSGYSVTSARLTFFLNKVTVAGTLSVSRVTSSWSESTVTYVTRPGVSSPIVTAAAAVSSTFVTVDVTTIVAAQLASGNYGFEIAPDGSAPNTWVTIDSKESTTTAHPAVLQVTYAPIPSASAGFSPAFTTVSASQTVSCNQFPNCPMTVIVQATCPASYTRIGVVQCSPPLEGCPLTQVPDFAYLTPPPVNFESECVGTSVYYDPAVSNKAGCAYSGYFSSLDTETLSATVLCAKLPPNLFPH